MVARPSFVDKINPPIENTINPKDLEKHVKHLSVDLAPRSIYNQENLKKAGMYVNNELSKYSNEVSIQKFKYQQNEYFNVIAKFGNLTSDKIIIVGAHYDAFDKLPGSPESKLPAADDNASSVAGLIELGKLLSKTDLNYQVHLVAYSLEESPTFGTEHMGSFIHAESVKNKDIELMIAFDMIGYYSEEEGSQEYPLSIMKTFYPSKGNFIAVVDSIMNNNAIDVKKAINKYTNIEAYSINAPAIMPGIDFSDHRNYWKYDIPAVMITNTAFYRNKDYHTPRDTYDRLDYNKMSEVVFGVFMYLSLL